VGPQINDGTLASCRSGGAMACAGSPVPVGIACGSGQFKPDPGPVCLNKHFSLIQT
jgi:hypothetical protein